MDTSAVSLLQQCLKSQEAADKVIFHLIEVATHEIQGRSQTTTADAWLYRDGDRLKYKATYTDNSGKIVHFVEVIKSDMQIRYQWSPPQKAPSMGAINKATSMQAFAKRCGELDGYDVLTHPSKRLAAVLQEYHDLRILGEEMIGETLCKVISAKTPYGEYTLWLAENMGCLPLKWTHKAGPTDKNSYSGGKTYAEVDKDLLSTDRTIDNIVIQKFDQVFFPVRGQIIIIQRSIKYGEIKDVFSITRDKIQLNPSFKEEDFSIDLPEGSRVIDNDRSGVLYESRGGQIVPAAHADFSESAEGEWSKRSPWLRIVGWLVSGLALLIVALRVIWHYKKEGDTA
jgi:hypothetical protein